MSTCAHERLRQVWCTHHVAKTEADEVVAPPLARRLHLPALDRLRSEGVTQRPARGSRPVVGRQRHWGCCSIAREALNGENADPVKSGVLDIGLCEPHCGHCHSARAQRHQQSQTACNLLSRRAGEPLASHLMVGQDAAVDCSSDVVGNVRLDSTLEAGAARGGGGAAGLLPAAI